MRRVVVTGLGLVTPLGCGVDFVWSRLLEGRSGAGPITTFNTEGLSSRIACSVPRKSESVPESQSDIPEAALFNPDACLEKKEQRKADLFIVYALAAAQEALNDAGWHPKTLEEQTSTGVLVGSGIGGLTTIYETSVILHERGPRKVSPFFIPGSLINSASGYISMQHGLKGPNHAVVTACSTGSHAIGDAARLIACGDADVMVAGGAESPVNPISLAGFCACRALSTHFNDTPQRASRPFDKDRDGFVIGEGAGIVVLESLEHAQARGAHIYAELIGYGLSGDAYHITAPEPEGDGAFRCMEAARKRARIDASEIDYINAHGTSTPVGDGIELKAVKRFLASSSSGQGKLAMSSTKSSIGHLLGAAGSVEAIFSILAIRDNQIPPTLNLDCPPPDIDINLVPHVSQKHTVNVVLSNSFGFGGTNASLIFQRYT
jgi:3-oxoacyl-[acyl-carrier-protein] synthase II